MRFRFHKMHGLGNDFVVVDAREAPFPLDATLARGIADRRRGVGCDQLILLEPSGAADVRMRILNADGGEVEACGNAARCIALLLGGKARIETAGGVISASANGGGNVIVEMGMPLFDWREIPLAYAMDTGAMPVGWEGLERPVAVNVGNPHAIFWVDDCDAVHLARIGPLIEHDALFPERVNVNVATIESRIRIRLRVWERGTGATLACGTGACATAVAAIRAHLVDSPVTVALPGGDLRIAWTPGEEIEMRGQASLVFSGEADTAAFA